MMVHLQLFLRICRLSFKIFFSVVIIICHDIVDSKPKPHTGQREFHVPCPACSYLLLHLSTCQWWSLTESDSRDREPSLPQTQPAVHVWRPGQVDSTTTTWDWSSGDGKIRHLNPSICCAWIYMIKLMNNIEILFNCCNREIKFTNLKLSFYSLWEIHLHTTKP